MVISKSITEVNVNAIHNIIITVVMKYTYIQHNILINLTEL